MRGLLFLICGLIFSGVGSTLAEEPHEELGIGLVAVGSFPPELLERLRSFAEFNTAMPIRIRPAQPYHGKALFEEGATLATVKSPSDVALVALAYDDFDFKEHAVYRYADGIAVINARALQVGDPDAEGWARRLEKLTMRSIGLLLDVDSVPNPLSAMYPYQSMEELDMMGRNYDPPSLLQVQRKAMQRGIRLQEDTPFNMTGPADMPTQEEQPHD